MKIIENANAATDVWNGLKSEDKKLLTKYFHLRPTNSGITIISTLPFLPMRGIVTKNKKDCESNLKNLINQYKKITQTNEFAAKTELINLGFKERGSKTIKEENYQAVFINTMSQDENLMKTLSATSKINFVASELIFDSGKNRVDVVGFDGTDLYFFEFKKDRTKKVDQVADYLKYYTAKDKLLILKELLKNYPINPVKNFRSIKGVMTMKYAESSITDIKKWSTLAIAKGIEILFFQESLKYTKA